MCARTVRDGDDLVVIAYGAMVHAALEAADADRGGAACACSTCARWCRSTRRAILDAVHDCAKVVIVDEANYTCAAGAQVASLIAQHGFADLDGPVVRVATPDVPIPFAPSLERAVLPASSASATPAVSCSPTEAVAWSRRATSARRDRDARSWASASPRARVVRGASEPGERGRGRRADLRRLDRQDRLRAPGAVRRDGSSSCSSRSARPSTSAR